MGTNAWCDKIVLSTCFRSSKKKPLHKIGTAYQKERKDFTGLLFF